MHTPQHRKYTQLVNSKTIQDSEVRFLYTVKPVNQTVSKFVDMFLTNMILHQAVHYQSILMYNLLFSAVQFSNRFESTQSDLLSYFPDFSSLISAVRDTTHAIFIIVPLLYSVQQC